ncbi:MAG: A/G-specific adenine glycosylase [Pseudomonadota bacterium]
MPVDVGDDGPPSQRGGADDPRTAEVLDWYDRHRRRLPWRAEPDQLADPYAVWLSEIMLQQTTVKAVKPYFERFLGQWPTVSDLANAPLNDVLSAWAGLGYYARARNLHKAAVMVRDEFSGRFPDTEDDLRTLPGVGAYTAAAIAAIAFGQKATPVDGNIERVMARLFDIREPLPKAKPTLKLRAESLTPDQRAGDFAQALMDLGATICTPKTPACVLCPLTTDCKATAAGVAADLPKKLPKKPKPVRRGAAFCIVRADGAVLLRQRPPEGLLGGMSELPGSPWQDADSVDPGQRRILDHAPMSAQFVKLPGSVRHVFTHFELDLTIWRARFSQATPPPPDHWWSLPEDQESEALPSVMRKALAAGLSGADIR